MSITTTQILKKKGNEKITMITAYDALFAKIFDGEVDMILVGDSLHMSFYGANDTLGASLDSMIYHTNAVCNGSKESLVVCDLPFGVSKNVDVALDSAIRVYKETKAQAVKLEGGVEIASIVENLTKLGIAVVGHIGLKPQFVRSDGGYKIKGKNDDEVEKLLLDAKSIESAGAFCIVLEGIKSDIAREITNCLTIPTIGIGSGVDTDGQVLVWSDAFGFFDEFKPKFVRRYLDGSNLIRDALREYVSDVKSKNFPNENESY